LEALECLLPLMGARHRPLAPAAVACKGKNERTFDSAIPPRIVIIIRPGRVVVSSMTPSWADKNALNDLQEESVDHRDHVIISLGDRAVARDPAHEQLAA
jgi:hypothetical protein